MARAVAGASARSTGPEMSSIPGPSMTPSSRRGAPAVMTGSRSREWRTGGHWTGPNNVEVDASGAEARELDPELCARIRASILLAGPMLARFGRVTLPPPGGDVIGRRRIDTHFLALEQLGADVTVGTA